MTQDTAPAPPALPLFHHAVPVVDLDATRRFYGDLLGCPEGRSSERTVDFRFFGHHIVGHLVSGEAAEVHRRASAGRNLALRHFGVVLPWAEWDALADRLRAAGVDFVVEPTVRYAGEPREEALLLVVDPSGNGVEFKAFRDVEYFFRQP